MSRDLKDLIENAEVDDKTRAELEMKVETLSEKIKRLNKIIEDQEILLNEWQNSVENKTDVPIDVQILKDMIVSQRQDLVQKNEHIEILKDQIAELDDARTLISQLMDENELYRANESNTKRMIQELMKQNEEYQKETESLKLRLNSRAKEQSIPSNSQELLVANKKIEELTREASESQSMIKYLQQELERVKRISSEHIVSTSLKSQQLEFQNPLFVERPEKPSELIVEKENFMQALEPSRHEAEITSAPKLPEHIKKKEFVSLSELKKEEHEITVGISGRRECPKCGNRNMPLIKELLDKTNVIMMYPKMYGKKYRCGMCGCEWRPSKE